MRRHVCVRKSGVTSSKLVNELDDGEERKKNFFLFSRENDAPTKVKSARVEGRKDEKAEKLPRMTSRR